MAKVDIKDWQAKHGMAMAAITTVEAALQDIPSSRAWIGVSIYFTISIALTESIQRICGREVHIGLRTSGSGVVQPGTA